MIGHAMTLEDREERNRAARAIIEVMGQLNPHLRDVDDYRHKLWTHLFVMSGFQLDVDSPYEMPKPEVLNQKPERIEYPTSKIRYGHYGQYTQKILAGSKDITDPDERNFLVKSMGNFMKMQFLTYNNDAVENNVIANQLSELSKGDLTLDNPDDLVSTNAVLRSISTARTNQNNARKKNPKLKKKKK